MKMDAEESYIIQAAREIAPEEVEGLLEETLSEKGINVTDRNAPLNMNRRKMQNILWSFDVPGLDDPQCTVGTNSSFNEMAKYIRENTNHEGKLAYQESTVQDMALVGAGARYGFSLKL